MSTVAEALPVLERLKKCDEAVGELGVHIEAANAALRERLKHLVA